MSAPATPYRQVRARARAADRCAVHQDAHDLRRLGLIGKTMFAIDGLKLPADASKEKSGTQAELAHRAEHLERGAARIVALHQAQDEHGEPQGSQRQARIDELRREARTTREFIATHPKCCNRKGAELKTNVTDPDSAKMATSKGVIQGYAAQAAADSASQVLVAADITGSGSEQAMLLRCCARLYRHDRRRWQSRPPSRRPSFPSRVASTSC